MKLVFLFLIWLPLAKAQVLIPKGTYVPMFKEPGESNTVLEPFVMDKYPVINSDFLTFVKANQKYRKSKIPDLFADEGYLSHWTDDLTFNKKQAKFPVVHVSWFAARKYCEWKEKRLPTIAEWEYAADANDPENEKLILNWYAKPNSQVRPVGEGNSNKFGIEDIHGQTWEWVENFSEIIMSGDSRGGSPTDPLFCGGTALKAKDPSKYAAFIRFAHRSSLQAAYTSQNLGFRCVRNMDE